MSAFKPLLPWPRADSSEMLIDYVLDQLNLAGVESTVVVAGNREGDVRTHLERVGGDGVVVVTNDAFFLGKAGSVRVGAAASDPSLDALIVIGVDQPRPAWMLRAVLEAHVGLQAPISLPTYRGTWGHPPVFARHLRDQLLSVREETQGLRPVVRGQYPHVQEVPVDSPIALLNLNTRADYLRGMEQFEMDRRLADN